MRRYPSESNRNLWHAAAERWRDAGRTYLDDPRFLVSRRALPLPLPVMVALGAALALGLWLWAVGG